MCHLTVLIRLSQVTPQKVRVNVLDERQGVRGAVRYEWTEELSVELERVSR